MNILFYGNCQLFAIKNIINLNPAQFNQYHIECFSTFINKEDYDNILKKCDIIITQQISKNYREKEYLSTEYLINNCNPKCKIIIFDSCHFDFYYFDLTYKFINGKLVDKPSHYHYNNLIKTYKSGLSEQHYIDNYINNEKIKSVEELEIIANNSLDELQKRFKNNLELHKNHDNVTVISSYEYIKKNYKNKLLFYSMNHPTKYVLHDICEQILKLLCIKNTINYELNVLDGTRCIIYKCIQNVVNFNINDYPPLLDKINNVESIVKKYYESYKEFDIRFD